MAAADEEIDDDFRCAPWTAAQGFDPIGSATTFDRLITIEVPGPWPSDVAALEWIAPLEVPSGTRVQAIVPESGRTDGTILLTRWERVDARLRGIDCLVAADDVTEALAALVAGDLPEGEITEAPDEILICSHGTRDRCCGGPGTRLAVETRAALPAMRVRRTSHLGGHRFAPTALTLPDGRMWAFLDADALAGIVQRDLPAGEAREFYRGNVALDAWAQVVEGAVLDECGWANVDFDEVAATSEVDGDQAAVTLSWTTAGTTDERTATVEIAGRYPVLQCGLAPSAAKKQSPEYRIVG
ncbi:sucrase ferredoxin [Actinospongicola halichondriae]|uniref:sucrase ferredoxin n=1 Tax=Actinospongicola halichondriae TaxID=3236844 RepID=UPI003D55EE68